MTNSEKMLACLDRQDLKGAEKYFQRALAQDDDDILLELGEYLEAIGFYPQAKIIYHQLAEQYPHVNLSLAQIASEDGDTEQAFLHLGRISEDSDDYVAALMVMADLYDSEGLTDVAREKLLLASQRSTDPLILFGLAELEMSLEAYQEAIDHYAQLDNRQLLEETGVSTYERIGQAYARLGKFDAAQAFLEKSLEIEHDDQTLFELGVLYYEQEQFERASLCFKQLETLNPEFPGYEYVYAKALQANHNGPEALRLVQQALRKNPFDRELLLLAGQLAYENKDDQEAESYLKEALLQDGQDDEALFNLANLYAKAERYDDLLSLNLEESENSLTRWLLAQAYVSLDRDGEAIELYDQLQKELAENPEFLVDYARFLRKRGDLVQALNYFTQYSRLVPDDSDVELMIEELLTQLDD